MCDVGLKMRLETIFDIGKTEETPVFKDISKDTYRQLETGIYDTWGRRMNITPRILDENGIWTGEYKDWSHLQEIKVRQGFFEYLNATWLFKDQRPNKTFKCFCKEAYIFDVKVIIIQELHHDDVRAKILTGNEELKLHIEDILKFKPRNVVPKREIYDINALEHQGLEFGSSQLKINMNTAEEKTDEQGFVITNLDHFDSYTYEVYDSLRNLYQHMSYEKAARAAEEQCKWLEEWIEKHQPINSAESLDPYLTTDIMHIFERYTYENKNFWDRDSKGYELNKIVSYKTFSIDELDYIVVKGKKIEKICDSINIPITVGWDVWKIVNIRIMKRIVDDLYEKYPV